MTAVVIQGQEGARVARVRDCLKVTSATLNYQVIQGSHSEAGALGKWVDKTLSKGLYEDQY